MTAWAPGGKGRCEASRDSADLLLDAPSGGEAFEYELDELWVAIDNPDLGLCRTSGLNLGPALDCQTRESGVNVRAVAGRPVHGQRLSDRQAAALTAIATSGRRIDLLVGPAGAGKTTAMRALRTARRIEHGTNSIVGLAPSAAAAQVLADDIGISCENTHSFVNGRPE